MQDVLHWKIEEHRREQRQMQGPDPRAARRHLDVEGGGGLVEDTRCQEHADPVEAHAVRSHGRAGHLTAHGHQSEAGKLRRSGHQAVEMPFDGAIARAHDAESEVGEGVDSVDRPPAAACGRGRSRRRRSGRNERARREQRGEGANESLHTLPLSRRSDEASTRVWVWNSYALASFPVIPRPFPCEQSSYPAGGSSVEISLLEVDAAVAP